ncbi:MAG: hypothetical protein FAZ92_01237 [Accumulibacter sp.]|uniref:hypothetical protein n=1 Tax=Accumulibacter sp. TaxID=2053492 RepID=UPI0012169C19|nr:hypothetical protein [Accumulibacter sp.]QKS30728.1 MAG: hypothetical protein HT579_18470 [Candidatus Accumulibacter similis]TLD46454.1 MAG: hypothetical protein FAZ92_01237 [Accumulibacter sp.]
MGILDWLFGGNDVATGTVVDPAVIETRIEQVVGIVNPRLKLVPGYRRRLAPAVEQAVLYCRKIEAQIPRAIEASAALWADNPVLRAVFASARDVPAVFSRSRAVQDFFDQAADADHVWAALRFIRCEEQRVVVATSGDVVQRDVVRTAVSCGDKKVVLPSGCEEEARLEIRRRAFRFLANEALRQIASAAVISNDLATQRSILLDRLMILKGQRAGLETVVGHGGRREVQIEEVEASLSRNEQALAACSIAGNALEHAIERIQHVLMHGADHLHIETARLRLDQMNLVVPEGSDEAAVDIALPLVVVRSAPVISLLPCRFPRRELIRRRTLLSDAQRWVC